jgi:UDP-glucose 4-epimerase
MADRAPLVAVTGGAGFIGSHTVDALVAAGCQVVVLDDFSTGTLDNLRQWEGDRRVEVVTANVADGLFAPLHEVTARRGPVDRVIHLAAQTSVVYSIDNPLDEVRTNCVGTVQVLDYARRTGVKKLVLASSAAVYGDVAEVPVAEEAVARPLSPYGIDKLTGELWLGYHAAVHELASVPLRFFNVYGPRQDPASPYSGVISIFVDRAMAGRELVIFGDGSQTRDFIYVADVVRAILAAAMGDGGDASPINIATGRETTVAQLASEVARLCGSAGGIRHAPARPGEILRSRARVSRAEEVLGFAAEVSLAEGLSRTIEWVRGAAGS